MGIELAAGVQIPEITYNRVFLVRLDVRQEDQIDDTLPPVYKTVVKYRMYGVDPDGMRHYSGEGIKTIPIKDFLEFATDKALSGDPVLLQALSSIQDAVAAIVADDRKTTATVT